MGSHLGRHSPSGARSLSVSERIELVATALGLPTGWVVTLNEHTGQLAITRAAYLEPYEAYVPARADSASLAMKRHTSFRARA